MPAASVSAQPTSSLHIHGPHWTSTLTVYDHQFRQVLQGVGEIRKDVLPGVYEIEAVVGSTSDRRQVVVRPGAEETVGPGGWDIKLSTVTPLKGTTTTHEWHEGPAKEWSRQITWQGGSGESRMFLFARAIERNRGQDFEPGLRLADADGKIITDFSEGVEQNHAESWLAFTADLPPGGYVLGYGRRGVPTRWQPVWLCRGFETQLFLPVVPVRGPRGGTRSGSGTGAHGPLRPSLSRMSVQMATIGAGFDANDDLMRSAEALLAAIRRGRLFPDDPSGEQDKATFGGGLMSQQMEELLMGKYQNPWLGILALHGLALAGEGYQALGAGVLDRMKKLVKDHPDLRAVELGLNPQASIDPFPFPPMLLASLRFVQDRAIRDAAAVPAETMTVSAIEHLYARGAWTTWRSPEPIHREKPVARAAVENDSDFAMDLTDQVAPYALERLETLTADPQFDPAAPASLVERATVARAAAEASFDAPAMEGVRIDTPDLQSVIEQAGTLRGAEEVSRQVGLPLARTQEIIDRLRSDPSRLAQPLTRGEQAVVATAMEASRRSQTVQERRAPETTLDPIYLQLVQYARDLKGAAAGHPSLSVGLAARMEQIARTLLERDDVIVVTGPQGEIRSVNRALLMYAGFEPDDFEAFWGSPYPGSLQQALSNAPDSSTEQELLIPRRSGDALPCKVRRTPVTEGRTGRLMALAIRTPAPPPFRPEDRERVRRLAADLDLYVPLLLHADPEDSGRYLSSVGRVMDQLEEVTSRDEAGTEG